MKSTRKNIDAKLNNLKSRIQGRSQDFFRGLHNSPKAPNPGPPPPPSLTSNVPKGGGYCKPKRFTISKITSCVYFHVLRTTSHIKKISRRGRAGTAKKCTKKRAKHTRNVQLSSPSSFLIKPRPSFTDVCKSLGIRMCF